MPEIGEYLPDLIGKNDKRMPERDFFYKVVNARRPDIVDSAIEQALALRKPKGQQLQEQQWAMTVKDEWIDQLLLHDYSSTKKGYGLSSLLMQRGGPLQQTFKRQKTGSSSETQFLYQPVPQVQPIPVQQLQ